MEGALRRTRCSSKSAQNEGTWRVSRVEKGRFKYMPYFRPDGKEETQPLLRRVADQAGSMTLLMRMCWA